MNRNADILGRATEHSESNRPFGFARDRYYVSASHRVRAGELGMPSLPYGELHARQVGSPWTLCGHAALNWPMFYELPFEVDSPHACEECAARVRALAQF